MVDIRRRPPPMYDGIPLNRGGLPRSYLPYLEALIGDPPGAGDPGTRSLTLSATLEGMSLSSTATAELVDVDINIFPENFVIGPAAIEQGLGGSSHRTWYLRTETAEADIEYIWHTKNDGSTGPGVVTGIDPGTYVAELAGGTGIEVSLAAGYITAATRATAVAAAMETRPWCVSATVAGADNPDGSRTITAQLVGGTTIAVGSRDWASRGAAGIWGSHAFRRALNAEIAGAADTAMTRNIAQLITAPPATAQIHAVSILLGATVSTVAANIPRLYLRSGSVSTTIPGATMLFDFGQLPVSEVLPGRRARINLTSSQSAALRTALTGAVGQIWFCVKAAATTQNSTLPVGGGTWNGELADSNLRVDTVTSGDGSTAAPGAWNNTGAQNFPALLGVAFHYEVDPPGNGEAYPVCGSLRDLSTAPNEVTLPNTVTRQVASMITGHQGAHIHTVQAQLTDTGPRYGMKGTNDTTTITADPDDPNLTGATTLIDFGQAVSTGTVTFTAPTGDASISVPAVFIVEFKGTGLRGFGWTTLPSGNTPIQANDFIYANGAIGSADGTNQHELDYAGESGNPTTAFINPIAGVATQPNNLPALRITLRRSPDVVVLL